MPLKDNRKILLVITGLAVGGAEKHVAQIAPLLKQCRYHPQVYSLALGGTYHQALQRDGITVSGVPWGDGFFWKRLRPLKLLLDFCWLWCCLMRFRPAIVHFFLPKAYLLGSLSSLLAGKCIRIMSRRSLNDYQQSKPYLAALERLFHPHMQRILGNSNAVLRQLLDEGVAADKLRLIYNGIELDLVAPQSVAVPNLKVRRVDGRARLGVSADTLLLVMVANLIPYKGHMDLLQALHLAKSQIDSPWLLILAGRDEGVWDGFYRQALAWGLSEQIRWLGAVADARALFAAADIGILCSHQEGFSNSLLEGMAEATAMLVTDVGGNAEAVVDGVSGLVVPAKNPQRLCDALVKLAADQPLRDKMGAAAYARVASEFSIAACMRQYDQVYSELLQR